jgi:hypothetical protein
MTVQSSAITPLVVGDDGTYYVFQFEYATPGIYNLTGFLHTPITASEPLGNPPVTWAQSSDLGSWVETIKFNRKGSGANNGNSG